MTQQSNQSSAFLVRDGEVAGVDPQIVLLETADRQHEVFRVDQLDGWFQIGNDGVARPLRAPTRQHRHKRRALRRVRSAIVGQHSVCTLCGTP